MFLSSTRRLGPLVLLGVIAVLVFLKHPTLSSRTIYYKYSGTYPIDADIGSGITKSNLGQSQQPVGSEGHNHRLRGAQYHGKAHAVLHKERRVQGFLGDALVKERPITRSTSATIDIGSVATHRVDDHTRGSVVPLKHLTNDDVNYFVNNLTTWKPLHTDRHWPSWSGYKNFSYDPNRWEGFDWELGYYAKNGIKRLDQSGTELDYYLPYPPYDSHSWQQRWHGMYRACQGPRGRDLDESPDDLVKAYKSRPYNFPAAAVGSAQVVGLNDDICFDRINRYGPYGHSERSWKLIPSWTKPKPLVKWSNVRWGALQAACLKRNELRFSPEARNSMATRPTRSMPRNVDELYETEAMQQSKTTTLPAYKTRTALLMRTWEGYDYAPNDLQALRALIMELALLSGGEYQVVLFVNVKQLDVDIYSDEKAYQDVLRRAVPPELRDFSVLWTEQVVSEWYPKVGDWQVYWHQFMPVQWFSKTHPEFDFVWNWETDARYTGNHYEFLERMVDFSRKMPRKNLWERSSRLFFPEAHGNYASFLADTDAAIANATASGSMTPVWGPQPYNDTQSPIGPRPPTSYEADDFKWGAGEEADLIALQPIWDPNGTKWSYRHKLWNFVPGVVPRFTPENPGDEKFHHPAFDRIPRRVFINTVARFSKRMLHAMHLENRAGRSMQAEMWPATVALHHGLKAVYAPHPIWLDRKWPAWYLDATFNAEGNASSSWSAARWAQGPDSPYNHDREAAFRGWSWYYSTTFPRTLYRRWMGWKATDILGSVGGARDFEDRTSRATSRAAGLPDGDDLIGGHGRMCLPGMLLHPVKKMREESRTKTLVRRAFEEDRIKAAAINEEVERVRRERGWVWGQ